MALEKTISTQIIQYLNSLDGCISEKIMGNAESSGRPDIGGCYKGQCFRIEVKTPDHKNVPSRKQLQNLFKWAQAGSVVMVAYSVKSVKRMIETLNDPKHKNDYYIVPDENGCKSSYFVPSGTESPELLIRARDYWRDMYRVHNTGV